MSGSASSGRSVAADPHAVPLHGLPADSPQRRRAGRLKMLLVLLVCAAPVAASYFTYFVVRPDGRTNYGELIEPTRAMPVEVLHTLDGEARESAALRGQWLLVVVAPASCGERCERLLHAQRQLREMLGRDRDRLDKVWFVSDDGAVRTELRRAVAAAPEVTVLRFPAAALQRWLQPAAGHALDEHLYVVDPMGQWMMRFPAQFEPAKVKRDLERLMRASASWDRAGR